MDKQEIQARIQFKQSRLAKLKANEKDSLSSGDSIEKLENDIKNLKAKLSESYTFKDLLESVLEEESPEMAAINKRIANLKAFLVPYKYDKWVDEMEKIKLAKKNLQRKEDSIAKNTREIRDKEDASKNEEYKSTSKNLLKSIFAEAGWNWNENRDRQSSEMATVDKKIANLKAQRKNEIMSNEEIYKWRNELKKARLAKKNLKKQENETEEKYRDIADKMDTSKNESHEKYTFRDLLESILTK